MDSNRHDCPNRFACGHYRVFEINIFLHIDFCNSAPKYWRQNEFYNGNDVCDWYGSGCFRDWFIPEFLEREKQENSELKYSFYSSAFPRPGEGGSSCGKTTACHVAASVWGDESHVRSWRATDNALEGMAALHNDNLLVPDEVGQIKARALDEAVYMLANGSGKARAGRDGGLRKQYRWQTITLSSGELGLADKLAEDGRTPRSGQDVRFAGIPLGIVLGKIKSPHSAHTARA